jgi:phage shock protein C
MEQARLMRSESDKMIAGVCGGLAAYLGVDSVFVRLAFVVLLFASGIGFPAYIVLAILMPSEESVGKSSSEVAKENLSAIGANVSEGLRHSRRHPQGPIIAGGLLIALGGYLLLQNLGWFSWLSGGLLWALALIALGIFLVIGRTR